AVRHELWDENIQDHADQGVAILVKAQVAGKDTTLLRFNCFDIEKSYDYGPENKELAVAGPEMLGDVALTNHYIMDPIACGNPIGWSIKTIGSKLTKMLDRAGYPAIAKTVKLDAVRQVLPEVEACAREVYATKRNTVKHNRGTDIFDERAVPVDPVVLVARTVMVMRAVPEMVEREHLGLFGVGLARRPADIGENVDREPAIAHRQPPHLKPEAEVAAFEDIGAAVVLHGVALCRIDLAGAGL